MTIGHSDPIVATVTVEGRTHLCFDLQAFAMDLGVSLTVIPYAGRVLIESLLRNGERDSAGALARQLGRADAATRSPVEFAFRPARLIMQDYTGIPSLVDLAALRDRVADAGGDASTINPVVPTDVVVDHSLLVEHAGSPDAQSLNEAIELRRNRERYGFLRWAQTRFDNLRVVPPGEGIVHQVNLERLADVVAVYETADGLWLSPDSVIGTDSHTTMVNGLGVLGWGVGGLEAEAIMLGMPIQTALPECVGVRLHGALAPGVSSTDLALTLTAFLRAQGVVGALVEFVGPSVAVLRAADRCTVANMAPEYGAMAAYFPVDAEVLRYLAQTGRPQSLLARVEAGCRRMGLWCDMDAPLPTYDRMLDFDLAQVRPTVAGPAQPHQRLDLDSLRESLPEHVRSSSREIMEEPRLQDGAIVLAAITSCTNTSNPAAMLAAGLLARRATARGLRVPGYVKTSLAPGSRAVTRYLQAAGLSASLDALGFNVVGYGCATCNGGGGPLLPEVTERLQREDLHVVAVLSGNRNFEGRIHRLVRANYLASPALVVAFALAGTIAIDLTKEPIAIDPEGNPVHLRDLWPEDTEIEALLAAHVRPAAFAHEGDRSKWEAIELADGERYSWQETSTYIRQPPYFATEQRWPEQGVRDARALLLLGDNISTDHISPVGGIAVDSPAGRYLAARDVAPVDFNNYGARRSNHEVMARAAFANERLRNRLLPGTEGGITVHLPDGETDSVFDVAMRYRDEGTPLVILAGENYGIGSSRDWAARGPWFLGVKAVIARSFERIHRSNLIAMGILPIEFAAGTSADSLGLDGRERYSIAPLAESAIDVRATVRVIVTRDDGGTITFDALVRIDSADELRIFRRGGILPHLLDRFLPAHSDQNRRLHVDAHA